MEPIPFIEYSLYQMFHMFIFWAFIGWGIEVCWMTLETGEYQNRGFLNMPICPIYGFGVIMVTVFFRPVSHTVIPLFIVTSILCTVFELLVGLGMEKLFGARWWDYSHERYNYKGYICIKISILWGMGCVIVIRLVQPIVEKFIDLMPVKLGLALIVLWSVLIVIDLISSICAVNKLNNRLKQIDEISKIMLMSAVKIGENLSQETLDVKGKYDKFIEARDAKTLALKQRYEKIVNAADFKVSEWKDKYEGLINVRDRSVERLLKAFPHMRSISYSESMETLRKRLNNRISVSSVKQSKKNGSEKNDDG
ncbi:MAG: putative ABC transporter permease [Oscillospiraceae bacterium]|nr:putative ABC transporter permease [Oscillospiraceae bacterium]MDE7278457.1 putative ABC transporter permease [Oscillospiraceae bacterium]